jgi:hypothetical protein
VGLFEYVVMTTMNYIYRDLIGKLVEIYIDDIVVKSTSIGGHLGDLRQVF